MPDLRSGASASKSCGRSFRRLPRSGTSTWRHGAALRQVIATAPLFDNDKLATLALRHAVLAIYQRREFAEAGGLMSYGASWRDVFRTAGLYVGQILKGAKPADLPFQESTKLELVINIKTAKALGLMIPPMLLARADEVIE